MIIQTLSRSQKDMLGYRSVTEGGFLYCGVTHQEYAINGVTYQWPLSVKNLKWSLNFSRLGSLSDMDFKDAATEWFKEITRNCDRTFEYTSNPRIANILYTAQRLDGKNGVLADMQIPPYSKNGGGNVNPETQLTGRFDDSEQWGLFSGTGSGIDLYRTGLHETEHAMGLGHLLSNINKAALIAAMYSQTIRNLQPETDVVELVRRYGESAEYNPPAPTPVPPALGDINLAYALGTTKVSVVVGFPSADKTSVRVNVMSNSKSADLSGIKQMT